MDKNNLKKFLDDKSWDYDTETIEKMLEEELEKKVENINMEFVDACMNCLTGYSENTCEVKDEVMKESKEKTKVINFLETLANFVGISKVSNNKGGNIMKLKKAIAVSIVFVLIFAISSFIINKETNSVDWSQVQTEYMQSSSPIFDLNDKSLYVGYSDYVFVGKVEKATYGGKYSDKYYSANEPFTDDTAISYTDYEVTVLQNIKGELVTEGTIKVKKHAGVNLKTNVLSILPGDFMPEEKEEYIFLTRATEKGELVIIDPCGNVPLSDEGGTSNTTTSSNDTDIVTTAIFIPTDSQVSTTSALDNQIGSTKEDIINSYILAYENEEEPIKRENVYVSIYDAER